MNRANELHCWNRLINKHFYRNCYKTPVSCRDQYEWLLKTPKARHCN